MANTRIKDQPTDTELNNGDYVIVDSESEGTRKYDLGALAARVEALEQGGGGTGLTQEEKDLILELFAKAAYADDTALSYSELETLWTIITRSVSLNLSHVTSSNQSASVEGGSRYTTTLTADTNYTLNSVSVTMGGVDITSTAYSSGTVSIPSVTGNIVITATAVLAAQSITATYTQSGTVYDTASLDSLKTDLVVTANYAGGTSETVPASDYTLSGTLTVGTSTITVTYAGLTTTFNVTVSHAVQDTTANVIREGVVLAHYSTSPQYKDYIQTNGGVTQIYTMDSPTTVLNPAGIIPTSGNVMKSAPASLYILDANDTPINFVSMASTSSLNRWAQDAAGTMTEYSQSWNVSEYSKIQFSVDIRYLDDAYMYDATTGQVWFAGVNTPYYGMTNISQASS